MVHKIGTLGYVSWSRQTLPELIWWDVLLDRAPHRFATNVAEKIAEYLKHKEKKLWWAFTSDYNQLTADEARGLREHLIRSNILDGLVDCLRDFLNLYPECPISQFLGFAPEGAVDLGYLEHFEKRMVDLEDKRSRAAVLVQAQAIYMGFLSGKFFVMKGQALADFPEVDRYPKTELSLQVGATICATVNMIAANMLPAYPEDAWTQYFWKRSLHLRPLDFEHLGQR